MENLYVTSEITLNKTAEKRSSPVPTNTEFSVMISELPKRRSTFSLKGSRWTYQKPMSFWDLIS